VLLNKDADRTLLHSLLRTILTSPNQNKVQLHGLIKDSAEHPRFDRTDMYKLMAHN